MDFIKCLNDNNYLGQTDWRLPNRKELNSLIDYSKNVPALPNNNYFLNVQEHCYWSSTTCATEPNKAWYVCVGYHGGTDIGDKNADIYVWPIRGGQ